MIQFLKQKSPANLLVLLIFGILIKMPLFIFPKTIVATENDEDLFHHLVNFINGAAGHSALTSMLAFLLLLIQAFMINYLVNEYRMMTRQNHLPAMAYLLITSLVPDWNYLSSPLISNTLIIWCFIKLFKLYNKANTKGDVFNIGLILGLSSYIYFPSAAFLICFLLGIMILKPFRLNEILLFLLGALTPYYFYGAYLFITGQFTVHNFVPNVSLGVPTVKSTIYLAISTFLLAIPFLVGGYYVQGHLHKMLIQVRKNWSIILLYLLLAFFVPFINTYMTFSNWILLAAPFATFHAAAYFYPNRNWFPMAMFLLTAGFVVYQQYFTNLWH